MFKFILSVAGPECDENSLPSTSSLQGLIPRVLKYIFSSMAATKEQVNTSLLPSCSYVEYFLGCRYCRMHIKYFCIALYLIRIIAASVPLQDYNNVQFEVKCSYLQVCHTHAQIFAAEYSKYDT